MNLNFFFKDLDESFNQYKAHNESKNIFKAARTPSVFFVVALFFYILSGIFGLVGIYSMANTCNFFMGIALIMLVIWAYVRFVFNTQINQLIH